MDISSLSKHPILFADCNGIKLAYTDEGSGPAIIFLHGFPDLANTWDQSIHALQTGYRCIAPFLRGYFPSDVSKDGSYSLKGIAEDILALADHLQLKEFYVVGQDWGASITYTLANLAPDRVKKILTIAIPHPSCFQISLKLLWFGRHFILFRNKKRALKKTRKNNYQYLDTLYKRWSPDWTHYHKTAEQIKESFQIEGRLEAALGYYWSFFEDQKNRELSKVYYRRPQMPVLFLGGKNDKGVLPKMLEKMDKKMPEGSKSIHMNNCGHFLHREQTNEFLMYLKDFFTD